MKNKIKPSIVSINFANKKAADHFIIWLCEQGEQDYWNWMNYREEKEDGDITAVRFDYDFKTLEVVTKLGRNSDE